ALIKILVASLFSHSVGAAEPVPLTAADALQRIISETTPTQGLEGRPIVNFPLNVDPSSVDRVSPPSSNSSEATHLINTWTAQIADITRAFTDALAKINPLNPFLVK